MSEDKNIIIAARERGPGPGRYALPSTCGFIKHDFTRHMQPSYYFGSRLGDVMVKKRDASPGPAYFIDPQVTRFGRDGTPSYSLLGRQRDQNSFRAPAPGAYSPEKVHPQGERHAPEYSISARTRYRKRDSNPSPNRYQLPQLLGSRQANKLSSPSYSMTGRPTVGSFSEDLAKTPGPGSYDAISPNTVRTKHPVYSLQGRSYMPGDTTKKPGPGQHSPEKVIINRPEPPKYSLGIRHSQFVAPLVIEISE